MKNNTGSHWISLSDMMTGLMLIFLLISILSISQIDKQKYDIIKQKEEIEKQKENIIKQKEEVEKQEQKKFNILEKYKKSRTEIYKELILKFSDYEKKRGVLIDKDLTIKFMNTNILFDEDKRVIKPKFKKLLKYFIKDYIKIINDPKYRKNIKEVRIEGHTARCLTTYINCIKLSQNRSNAVLNEILNHKSFKSLDKKDQRRIKFWLTSNGMSMGRTIDQDGNYTYVSGKPISEKSRRVEFKIVTNSDNIIDNIEKTFSK